MLDINLTSTGSSNARPRNTGIPKTLVSTSLNPNPTTGHDTEPVTSNSDQSSSHLLLVLPSELFQDAFRSKLFVFFVPHPTLST
jgi:hypothetical protein